MNEPHAQNRMTTVKELTNKLRDKGTIIAALNDCGYYVPPESMITGDYLREVLAGRKKLASLASVRIQDHVPHYPQINLKELWNSLKVINEMKAFFPDAYINSERIPDRTYLLTIFDHLSHAYYTEYLQQVKNLRLQEEVVDAGVEIKPDILQSINNQKTTDVKTKKGIKLGSLKRGTAQRKKIQKKHVASVNIDCVFRRAPAN